MVDIQTSILRNSELALTTQPRGDRKILVSVEERVSQRGPLDAALLAGFHESAIALVETTSHPQRR